jgi:ribonucleoside-diphosphate reductase alpha chain
MHTTNTIVEPQGTLETAPDLTEFDSTDNFTASNAEASLTGGNAVGDGEAKSQTPAVDLSHYRVRRRDGRMAPFIPEKIAIALGKAFLAAQEQHGEISSKSRELVQQLTEAVVTSLLRRRAEGGEFHIEEIQDQVELALMRAGEQNVARRYVLYREERKAAREAALAAPVVPKGPVLRVTAADGTLRELDSATVTATLRAACVGLGEHVDADSLLEETLSGLYDGIPQSEVRQAAIMVTRSRIEAGPEYAFVAARLLLGHIQEEVFGVEVPVDAVAQEYATRFAPYVAQGIAAGRLAPVLAEFDLERLAAALRPERDLQFAYMGLQTLYDRYLIHIEGKRIEVPQWFWMRIAMGLAQNESDRNARAIEFYNVLSQFLFVSSTPTLFNSGTCYPQLSSCYLTTIGDDLHEIFSAIRDNALLSKFSGGLGNDWTPVRALGAQIQSTNGKSQGIVPFLKVANDTAVAVNQGGKRQGAVCAYIEPWHLDVEEFLDLRKNTGDDRRRTHDMHTALWINDLFIQRVEQGGQWTLFSPEEAPDLHDLYGRAFTTRYEHYEAEAAAGRLQNHRSLSATELWRKVLTRLFETGHPWITFKDPSNLRSPQRHKGVVHSSNLCTEILLNTSQEEIAVCNLGSVNIPAHLLAPEAAANGGPSTVTGLDFDLLRATVATAMRMLDNVIDINLYPVPQARTANLRHRPVGLGIMGFQDALHIQRIPYSSEEAVVFADRSMEAISYSAILASSELAAERGAYGSYEGSLWDQGILPIDSIEILAAERDEPLLMARGGELDWEPVRAAIKKNGMRNSNCLAIAPTATIANIIGVSASIEPIFSNLFVKSNLSGDFTIVNPLLVNDLRERGLWDRDMIDDLKYFDGVLAEISRIPEDLRELYATAFEIEPEWLIEAASRRQKWIDMGQSLNIYLASPTGPRISEIYKNAWRKGLKTTYYLRTKAATQVEKSTLDINRKAIQPRWMKSESPSSRISVSSTANDETAAANLAAAAEPTAMVCSLDGDCEACQ